jgi:hypothetical protein
MRMIYRDGGEDEDRLFDLLPQAQRQYVAGCLHLGPNWIKESMWERLIDLLISVRRNEGKQSFYREIGRMTCPDLE